MIKMNELIFPTTNPLANFKHSIHFALEMSLLAEKYVNLEL
jgi:hypothetical protein